MRETNLNQLRDEVYEWSSENFGIDQPYQYPLLGIMEEFGELITSVLKRRQGIDDADKYGDLGDEYEMDAIGDMMVYLADFVARFPYTVDIEGELESWDRNIETESELETVWNIGAEIGALFSHESTSAPEKQYRISTALLIQHLEDFCEHRGFTLDDCIEEAWGEVQHREWESNVQEV